MVLEEEFLAQSISAQSKTNVVETRVDLEDDNDEVQDTHMDTSAPSQRTRKRTSKVWDMFEKVVVNGESKARCFGCNALLSSAPSSGTSHLKKHAEKVCPKKHLNIGTGSDSRASSKSPALRCEQFDQEFSRKELVSMVVLHEYPLSIVDHVGFRRFVHSLNSAFKMISRNTLKNDILKLFQCEKHSLKGMLAQNLSRIAITTDMWTASNQKKGYMVVTSHFINQEWVMQSRTLRFSFVPCPHTKNILAKVLMDCVTNYGLERKISSVVVDNCSTNDAMMEILLDKFETNALILGGEFLHVRCSAHILNLIVKDGLDEIDQIIEKIRDCVSFWMLTPKRLEMFEEACRFVEIESKMLVLDCKTRWNSTYLMLQGAIPFMNVFARLKRLNPRLKFVVPYDENWEMAKVVCEKLEIFYKATKVFSGRKYPTSNLFFRRICEIKLALRRWLISDVSVIRNMALKMIKKFDKYWFDINGILAVASILDPRNKLDCVEYYFNRIYTDQEAEVELCKIRKKLDDLLVEYQSKGVLSGEGLGGSSKQLSKQSLMRTPEIGHDDEDEFARSKRTKKRKVSIRCELEHYLGDDPLPDDDCFDILNFWKTDLKYPTLRNIARDILAIPISTVASESAFSMGGRVISPHRSRLHAKTVEAMMCLQNWMVQEVKDAIESTYACGTILDDSDDENGGGAEPMDIFDMDLDDDIEISNS